MAHPAGPLTGRILAPLAVAGGGLAAVVAVAVRDPHVPGSWGSCPLLTYTGLYCPGCGGLRAVHDLVHGHPLAAVQSNALGLALCAFLAVVWLGWFISRVRGRPVTWDRWFTPAAAWSLVAVMVAFSVFRNTPWGSWLAPAA